MLNQTWDISFIYLFYSLYMVVDSQIILDDYQCYKQQQTQLKSRKRMSEMVKILFK